MARELYLIRSTYSASATGLAQSYPGAMLVVSDLSSTPDVSQAFATVGSTIYKNNAPVGAGDIAGNWGATLVQQGPSYVGDGLHVFSYTLNVSDFDINGTLNSNDAYVQTTNNVGATNPLKITQLDATNNTVDVADIAPVRFARPGEFQMIDVEGQNPSWLSADIRTFRLNVNSNAVLNQAVQLPISALQIWGPTPNTANWNAADAATAVQGIKGMTEAQSLAFFNSLDPNEDQGSMMTEFPTENGAPVYNFALVRVRAVNTGAKDLSAQVVVRLFVTLNNNLAYDGFAGLNYPAPVQNVGTNRIGALGRTGANANPVCFPVFGDARVAAGNAQNTQTDATNLLSYPIPATVPEKKNFFAVAHVDINDTTARYPDATNPNGNDPTVPLTGTLTKLADIIKQAHVCMVAEIINPDDPTVPGSNPQSSGNLAQRNLAIGYLNNPGTDPNVRTIQHNFEFVPTVHHPKPSPEKAKTERPNELLFLSRDIPEGTRVDLFMPGLAAKRAFKDGHRHSFVFHGPPHPLATGDHTVSFRMRQAVRLPIPVDPGGRYPALLTVHFPAKTDVGKKYEIDVLQLDPVLGIVVGAFRLSTPVVKARTRVGAEYATADAATRRSQKAKAGTPWADVLAMQAQFGEAKARSTALEMVHEVGGTGRFVAVVVDRIEVPIARKKPMVLTAAVFEGGHRVGTHAITIPAGEPGIVSVGQVVFDGLMFDHLSVKLLDGSTSGPPVLRHERGWTAVAGRPLDHIDSVASSDDHHESSWRVWFHVVNKPGVHR